MSTGEYDLNRVEFKQFGAGAPPILLLHGWEGDLDTLTHIGKPLGQYRKVWTLSLPGFGNSPEPPVAWGTWEYVEFLRLWLEKQDIEAVDIIAHSFGGRISIGLASRHDQMVNRLVLMSSAGLRTAPNLRRGVKIRLAKWLKWIGRHIGGQGGHWLAEQRHRLGSTDWRRASPLMRGVLSRVSSKQEELAEELRRITSSTLLLWGAQDLVTPAALAQRMNDLLPSSKLKIFPDAGHFLYAERSGEVLSAIWQHLDLPQVW